jgi:uncharacterized protein YbcV (DUF1398 family)
METNSVNVLETCTRESIANTMAFPKVLELLSQIGVESYHVDLYRREKTYYFPNGDTYVEPMEIPAYPIRKEFSSDRVLTAIRASQKQEISYLEFLKQVSDAGTTHYYVYITGYQAVYYGRTGECHVEKFPGK